MMRGMTILWGTLALAVGVGLFLMKYQVQSLEDRLAALNGDIRHNQQTIHILKAEWSYLNDPERLRELNERHLGMKAFRSEQMVAITDLPMATPPTEPPPAAPAEPPGRLMVDAPAPQPQSRKPVENREAKAAKPGPIPAMPAMPAKASRPADAPAPLPVVVARPAPVLPARPTLRTLPAAAPGDVLVIKSPALLEAERRMGR